MHPVLDMSVPMYRLPDRKLQGFATGQLWAKIPKLCKCSTSMGSTPMLTSKLLPTSPFTNAEQSVDLNVLPVLPAKLPALLASPSIALLWQLPRLPCQLLLKPCTRTQVHLMQPKPSNATQTLQCNRNPQGDVAEYRKTVHISHACARRIHMT